MKLLPFLGVMAFGIIILAIMYAALGLTGVVSSVIISGIILAIMAGETK